MRDMESLRDPGGEESSLDICFCGERAYQHPTEDGCMEFQSLRRVTNTIANALTDLVVALLGKQVGAR